MLNIKYSWLVFYTFTAAGYCNDLPPLENGGITYSPIANPKRPGTIATHTCITSYTLVGNVIQVCQPDLTWSGSVPECRKSE